MSTTNATNAAPTDATDAKPQEAAAQVPSCVPQPKKTLVTFLLDRSSSMHSQRDEVIASFNDFVNELRPSKADIRMSFVQFDTNDHGMPEFYRVYVGQRIASVPALTREGYEPRGMTPLCDALATTIREVEASLKGRDLRVVIAVQTDGQENASREHSWESVRALVAQQVAKGWEFKFLGAGLESRAYAQAGNLGLSRGATVSYDSSDINATRAAFASTASNIRAFAEGAALSTDYSAVQKSASGDDQDDSQDAPGVSGAFVRPAPLGRGGAYGQPGPVAGGLIPGYMLRGGVQGVDRADLLAKLRDAAAGGGMGVTPTYGRTPVGVAAPATTPLAPTKAWTVDDWDAEDQA